MKRKFEIREPFEEPRNITLSLPCDDFFERAILWLFEEYGTQFISKIDTRNRVVWKQNLYDSGKGVLIDGKRYSRDKLIEYKSLLSQKFVSPSVHHFLYDDKNKLLCRKSYQLDAFYEKSCLGGIYDQSKVYHLLKNGFRVEVFCEGWKTVYYCEGNKDAITKTIQA